MPKRNRRTRRQHVAPAPQPVICPCCGRCPTCGHQAAPAPIVSPVVPYMPVVPGIPYLPPHWPQVINIAPPATTTANPPPLPGHTYVISSNDPRIAYTAQHMDTTGLKLSGAVPMFGH